MKQPCCDPDQPEHSPKTSETSDPRSQPRDSVESKWKECLQNYGLTQAEADQIVMQILGVPKLTLGTQDHDEIKQIITDRISDIELEEKLHTDADRPSDHLVQNYSNTFSLLYDQSSRSDAPPGQVRSELEEILEEGLSGDIPGPSVFYN